jgi:hypothetical protein
MKKKRNKRLVREDRMATQVVAKLGGATQAAEIITQEMARMGIEGEMKRCTVQKWINNGIPAKWVPIIAKLSGLPGYKLRPEIHP